MLCMSITDECLNRRLEKKYEKMEEFEDESKYVIEQVKICIVQKGSYIEY